MLAKMEANAAPLPEGKSTFKAKIKLPTPPACHTKQARTNSVRYLFSPLPCQLVLPATCQGAREEKRPIRKLRDRNVFNIFLSSARGGGGDGAINCGGRAMMLVVVVVVLLIVLVELS